MLEDRRPPANPWLPRNSGFVLVRGIIELFGVFDSVAGFGCGNSRPTTLAMYTTASGT